MSENEKLFYNANCTLLLKVARCHMAPLGRGVYLRFMLLPPPGGYVIILVCMCVCVCVCMCVCVFVCEHDNSKNNKHLDVKFCTYICHCLRKN